MFPELIAEGGELLEGAGAESTLATKEIPKVTKQNARQIGKDFVQDYSEENIQKVKESNKNFLEKIFEGSKDSVESLGEAIESEGGEGVGIKTPETTNEETTEEPKSETEKMVERGNPFQFKESIANLPRPTGISLLLVVILFIVFAIQPTGNGKTRLMLVWETILGKTFIGDNDPTQKKSFVQVLESTAGTVNQTAQNIINPFSMMVNPSPIIQAGENQIANWVQSGENTLGQWGNDFGSNLSNFFGGKK